MIIMYGQLIEVTMRWTVKKYNDSKIIDIIVGNWPKSCKSSIFFNYTHPQMDERFFSQKLNGI